MKHECINCEKETEHVPTDDELVRDGFIRVVTPYMIYYKAEYKCSECGRKISIEVDRKETAKGYTPEEYAERKRLGHAE